MTLDLLLPDVLAALFAGGAVVLSLVVGGALLGRRVAPRRARVFLGGFLVAGGLTLTNELVYTLRLPQLHPHFWYTPLLYTYALGPLLYFFVRARLVPERRLRRRDLWHAVLPGLQVVHELVTGFATLELKRAYWQSPFSAVYGQLDTLVFVVSFAAYLLASDRLIRSVRERPETAEPRRWLRRLVRGCAAIVVVALVMETPLVAPWLWETVGRPAFAWLRLAETIAYAALLYWVTFTGFVHTLPRPERPARPARRETYGMTDADLAGHVDRLRAHVADARPHLDPELTLGALADGLALTDKELSYVLNAGLGTGYADYVNGLRVGEAQRLLADPALADRPVLELAMRAGFASKPTFNRVFKAATGQTPTAFRAARAGLMAS